MLNRYKGGKVFGSLFISSIHCKYLHFDVLTTDIKNLSRQDWTSMTECLIAVMDTNIRCYKYNPRRPDNRAQLKVLEITTESSVLLDANNIPNVLKLIHEEVLG